MTRVIAVRQGYFGGIRRDVGDKFNVPNSVWADEKRRPSWVKVDPASVFGGKGDHDGDGFVGGSKPQGEDEKEGEAKGVVIPADWKNGSAASRKALAKEICGQNVPNAKEADAIIEAHLEANKPEVFGDAPNPETAAKPEGNELQEALGGVEPDWVPPEHGQPEMASD